MTYFRDSGKPNENIYVCLYCDKDMILNWGCWKCHNYECYANKEKKSKEQEKINLYEEIEKYNQNIRKINNKIDIIDNEMNDFYKKNCEQKINNGKINRRLHMNKYYLNFIFSL